MADASNNKTGIESLLSDHESNHQSSVKHLNVF